MSEDSSDPEDTTAPSGTGFSSAEKALGAFAAYEHPLISGLVAGRMRESETDPVKKRQLNLFQRASLIWWGAGLVIALIGFIVVVSFASSHGPGGDCRGGRDTFNPLGVSYQSSDDVHWTATYPCVNGGSTTVPIPRSRVPGEGH